MKDAGYWEDEELGTHRDGAYLMAYYAEGGGKYIAQFYEEDSSNCASLWKEIGAGSSRQRMDLDACILISNTICNKNWATETDNLIDEVEIFTQNLVSVEPSQKCTRGKNNMWMNDLLWTYKWRGGGWLSEGLKVPGGHGKITCTRFDHRRLTGKSREIPNDTKKVTLLGALVCPGEETAELVCPEAEAEQWVNKHSHIFGTLYTKYNDTL